MTWQKVIYNLTADAPLIMHNGQTADPMNKWAKLIKQISSKRSKTETDYEEIARLEFMAGLYMTADGPVFPQDVIDAMLIGAAKKVKEGPLAKAGCFTDSLARLEYDGPRTADKLWLDERFRFSKAVRIGTGRVMRMRPIFADWSAQVTLQVETSVINVVRVDEWMRIGGTQIGLCDWRPQHGRFTATRINGA